MRGAAGMVELPVPPLAEAPRLAEGATTVAALPRPAITVAPATIVASSGGEGWRLAACAWRSPGRSPSHLL